MVNSDPVPKSMFLAPELFCACRGERGIKSSGEPWSKIVSDPFQQKTINVFLIGPFKFARERLNVRRIWLVSGRFFPRNGEVNTTGRWATPYRQARKKKTEKVNRSQR